MKTNLGKALSNSAKLVIPENLPCHAPRVVECKASSISSLRRVLAFQTFLSQLHH